MKKMLLSTLLDLTIIPLVIILNIAAQKYFTVFSIMPIEEKIVLTGLVSVLAVCIYACSFLLLKKWIIKNIVAKR